MLVIECFSPFVFCLDNSILYDLDQKPVRERRWFNLKNMKIYYNLFKSYETEFENEDGKFFDKVTEEEFDRIYSYLRQINMPERYQKQICADEFLLYKTNYLYNLNQHINAI